MIESEDWGFAFGQFPSGRLVQKYGAKWFFGLSVFVPSVLSLLVPISCHHSVGLSMFLRALMGLLQSACFPALYYFYPSWFPVKEKTLMVAMAMTGIYMGNILGFSVSGVLVDSVVPLGGSLQIIGWPAVFYVFGLLGIVWFPLWAIFAYESPRDHPSISSQELSYILGEGGGGGGVKGVEDGLSQNPSPSSQQQSHPQQKGTKLRQENEQGKGKEKDIEEDGQYPSSITTSEDEQPSSPQTQPNSTSPSLSLSLSDTHISSFSSILFSTFCFFNSQKNDSRHQEQLKERAKMLLSLPPHLPHYMYITSSQKHHQSIPSHPSKPPLSTHHSDSSSLSPAPPSDPSIKSLNSNDGHDDLSPSHSSPTSDPLDPLPHSILKHHPSTTSSSSSFPSPSDIENFPLEAQQQTNTACIRTEEPPIKNSNLDPNPNIDIDRTTSTIPPTKEEIENEIDLEKDLESPSPLPSPLPSPSLSINNSTSLHKHVSFSPRVFTISLRNQIFDVHCDHHLPTREELVQGTPFRQFFLGPSSHKVYTIFLQSFVMGWFVLTLLSLMPTFLIQELHFSVSLAGILCVVPNAALFLSTLFFGTLYAHLQEKQHWSLRSIRQSAQYISMGGCGLCLVISSFTTDRVWLSYAFIVLSQLLFGAQNCGVGLAYLDLTPNYASVLNSVGSSISSSAGILTPIIVSALLLRWPGILGWRVYFLISAVLALLSLVHWTLYQSSDIDPLLNEPALLKQTMKEQNIEEEIEEVDEQENIELNIIKNSNQ